MEEVKIISQEETAARWEFAVAVDGLDYKVSVDRYYWQKLTGGREEPEELVKRSFEFLLAREPKESILREFNLNQIQNYFSDYEKEMTGLYNYG